MNRRREFDEFNPEKVLARDEKKKSNAVTKGFMGLGMLGIIVLGDKFKDECFQEILREQPTLKDEVANRFTEMKQKLEKLIPDSRMKMDASILAGAAMGIGASTVVSTVLKRGLKNARVKVNEQVFQALLLDLVPYIGKRLIDG